MDLLQGIHHILTHTVHIRDAEILFDEDALINAAAKVLGELPLQFPPGRPVVPSGLPTVFLC
jgi:hypothetical protein